MPHPNSPALWEHTVRRIRPIAPGYPLLRRSVIVAAFVLLSVPHPGVAQESPHGDKLKMPCETCHAPTSWKDVSGMSKFDHSKTSFPLVGQHSQVECRQCHSTLVFDDAPIACSNCHQDAHRAELGTTCDRCHSPKSWLVPDMAQRHNSTRYPLMGAHLSVPCQACHVNQQQYEYVNVPTDCIGCHRATFDGTNNPPHAASGIGMDCKSCHAITSLNWRGASFVHNPPLTGAHLAVSDCNMCHNGNFNVTAQDCYTCHKADYAGTTNPFHASTPGFNTNCTQCHISTNVGGWMTASTSSFPHNPPLTGAHLSVGDCNTCHSGNFTSTSQDCYSCHVKDYSSTTNPPHATTAGFTTNCTTCHTSTNVGGWTTVSTVSFPHNPPLTGAHLAVPDCNTCHTGNFTSTSQDCYGCHAKDYSSTTNPPHATTAGFTTNCITCHTSTNVGGWATVSTVTFPHNPPLTGAHLAVPDCNTCHKGNFTSTSQDCYSCHATDYASTNNPQHSTTSGFSTNCITCHTSTNVGGWTSLSTLTFPHNPALTGAHMTVADCNTCHKGNFTSTSQACYGCHATDYASTNNPPHSTTPGFSTNCITCHTSTNVGGWTSLSTISFPHSPPLTGAHLAVPDCNACHNGNFTSTSQDCYACHQSTYSTATTPVRHAPGLSTTCTQCHTTTGWQPSTFNHSSTPFQLTGSHVTVACNSCHLNGLYAGTQMVCSGCHQTDLATANANIPGHTAYPSDCTQCHNTTSFLTATFDHSTTGFPLTGGHLSIACNACHLNNNFTLVPPTTCGATPCHQSTYNTATSPVQHPPGMAMTCDQCHTTTNWTSAPLFVHPSTPFQLTGAHLSAANAMSCSGCHANGVYAGTPTDCFTCHTSDYNSTNNPVHSTAGYPTTCATCHSTTLWTSGITLPSSYHTMFPPTHGNTNYDCTKCHSNSSNYAVFSCTTGCHPASQVNPNHTGVTGYVYDNAHCYSCHPTGRSG